MELLVWSFLSPLQLLPLWGHMHVCGHSNLYIQTLYPLSPTAVTASSSPQEGAHQRQISPLEDGERKRPTEKQTQYGFKQGMLESQVSRMFPREEDRGCGCACPLGLKDPQPLWKGMAEGPSKVQEHRRY